MRKYDCFNIPKSLYYSASTRRKLFVAFLLAFACLILWNLINEGVLHGTFFDTLSKILVAIGSATAALGAILTVYVGIVSSLKTVLTPPTGTMDSSPNPVNIPAASPIPAPSPIPTIIPPLQPQTPQSSTPPSFSDKPVSGNITGSFPPTDPKTIQQRQQLVEQVYSELTKPGINSLVLTGIGGIGKSTLAPCYITTPNSSAKPLRVLSPPKPSGSRSRNLLLPSPTSQRQYLLCSINPYQTSANYRHRTRSQHSSMCSIP